MIAADTSSGSGAVVITFDYANSMGQERSILYWGGPIPPSCPTTMIGGDETVYGLMGPATYATAANNDRKDMHEAMITIATAGGGTVAGTVTNTSGSTIVGTLRIVFYNSVSTPHYHHVTKVYTKAINLAPLAVDNFSQTGCSPSGGNRVVVYMQKNTRTIVQTADRLYIP